MSAAAGAIVKKAIKSGAAYDMGAAFGAGKKIVGRRWKQAATRSGRSAMLANAAVGAVGGGLYGYTQGDWKSGALMGGAAGGAYWMAGGRRGIGLMARKGGLLQKNTAKAVENKAAGQAVGQQVSRQVATARPATATQDFINQSLGVSTSSSQSMGWWGRLKRNMEYRRTASGRVHSRALMAGYQGGPPVSASAPTPQVNADFINNLLGIGTKNSELQQLNNSLRQKGSKAAQRRYISGAFSGSAGLGT